MMKHNQRGFLNKGTLITLGVLAVLGGLLAAFLIGVKTINGDQVAVEETMSGGVTQTSFTPRTYFFNRFTTTYFPYSIAGQVFNMDTRAPKNESPDGWDMDTLEVKSADNQKVHISSKTRWQIDPTKIVQIHSKYRNQIEDRLIKAEVIRVVMSKATVLPAISLYSGESQNKVRLEIEEELKNPAGELAKNGVMVLSFVFSDVDFPNKEYVANIEARQLAIIRESRAKEDTKANLAEAEAAQAKAQKEAKERVVKSEADKAVAILNQEATSQQTVIKAKADAENAIITQQAESQKVVLAAKAEAERNIAISEAQKQAEINRAVGIEAIGRAEAEAKKLALNAFQVQGSELFARVEIARSMATMLSNVKGYLPQGVNYNTIGRDFESSVNLLLGQPATK